MYYNDDVPNNDRVDTVLGWLDLPRERRPTVYTLYFSDVDDAGHAFSPDSAETRSAVLRVDQALARLVDGLGARQIDKKVNIIVVSDHGMATVDQRNAVVMDELFDTNLAERVIPTGEIWQIPQTRPDRADNGRPFSGGARKMLAESGDP
jgi:predicted AlkP superfamily pyrophosphatase or phosphodiesterase